MDDRNDSLSNKTGITSGPITQGNGSIKTILIADDSYTCMLITKMWLEEETSANVRIVEAKDGTEALKLLESEKIDLMLLDIQMPGFSGIEIAEKAIDLGNPKTIFISACQERQYEKELSRISYDYYLFKPVSRQEFQSVMAKVGVTKETVQ